MNFSRKEKLKAFNKKCHNFCAVHYPRIDADKIDHGEYSFEQQRCSANAVAAARAGRADHVYMVWAGNKKEGVIHFINSKAGRFFDETWHQTDVKYHYRIIRRVHPNEYGDIDDLLMNCKQMFVDMFGCRTVRSVFAKDDSIGI